MAQTVKIDGMTLAVSEAKAYLDAGRTEWKQLVKLSMLGMEGGETCNTVKELYKRLDEVSKTLGFVEGGDKTFHDIGMNIWIVDLKGSRTFSGKVSVFVDAYYSRIHKRAVAYDLAVSNNKNSE